MERHLRRRHLSDPFSDDFEPPSLGASRRRSDVDYGDVFGGPPRNSPGVHDLRRNLGDTFRGYSGDEVRVGRRGWPSFGEMPVFGCGPSPRRKDLGEDFFSDIFGGSESVCSSPRRMEMMTSASSSRVLSPVRSLPPKTEGFEWSSLLPSQLSLSQKMAKELENSFSGPSANSSLGMSEGSDTDAGTYMPNIVPHSAEMQDYSKVDSQFPSRQSSLSHFSHDHDLSPKATQASRNGIMRQSEKDLNINALGHFHFSIYKWASKCVMLVLPSSSKEKSKNEFRLSGPPVPFLQGAEIASSNKIIPSGSTREVENEHNCSFRKLGSSTKSSVVKDLEKSLPQKIQQMSLSTSVVPEPGPEAKDSQAMSSCMYGTNTSTVINMEASIFRKEPQKQMGRQAKDTMNVHHEKNGKNNNKQDEQKQDLVSCTTSKDIADNLVEVISQTNKNSVVHYSNAPDIPEALEHTMRDGRVKGKVKEFIKIFDQEHSRIPVGVTESQDWCPKVKDFEKFKLEEQVKLQGTETTEKKSYMNNKSIEKSEASFTVEQTLKEKSLHFDMDSAAVNSTETSDVTEKDSMPCFESARQCSESSFEFEEFQVEYLVEEKNELPQTSSDLEDIQKSDAKVRAWSAGKEGNIRSMLSTLQYVLWTGSGWKPIPLVDIIESNSVKRAYQKALLCLHPDKLQQRGAPMHEKYIADKIFGILQEAWDHFQTVSGL